MTHYAVLIGNSQFPNSDLKPLHSPLLDIDGLADELKATGRGLFVAPQGEIDKLPNRTRSDIEKSLNKVLKKAGKNDLVLIYYSGHGLPNNKNNDLYLATQDTENELLESTAVSFDQLYKWISQSFCKRVVIILDCCYSGIAGDAVKGNVEAQLKNINDKVAGITLMTAASNDQVAIDRAEGGFSLFTKYLIDGLQGQADSNGNGVIGVGELFHYVSEKVIRDNPTQQPKRFLKGETGELIIAKSGRDSRKERADKFEPYLYTLAAEKRLPRDIVNDAISILSKSLKLLSPAEHLRDALIAECYQRKDAAEFIRQWVAADMTPLHAEREQTLQQREQALAAQQSLLEQQHTEFTEQLQTAREQAHLAKQHAAETAQRAVTEQQANQSAQAQLTQQLTDSQTQQQKLTEQCHDLEAKQPALLRQMAADQQELTRQQTELKQQQQRIDQAEQAFSQESQARKQAEEKQRVAEKGQQTAETSRKEAEKSRKVAEKNEQVAEQARQTAETALQAAQREVEKLRQRPPEQVVVEKVVFKEIPVVANRNKDRGLGVVGGGLLVVAMWGVFGKNPEPVKVPPAEKAPVVAPIVIEVPPSKVAPALTPEQIRLQSIEQAKTILKGDDVTQMAAAVQQLQVLKPLDSEATWLLARSYEGGVPTIAQDYLTACPLYKEAAEANNPQAKERWSQLKKVNICQK